jgi:serpin B
VLELAETLATMGMPNAFSASADFSAIAELRPLEVLYISRVLHKAFIDVDEEGTEAAAATTVVIELMTILETIDEPTEPPPIIMKIDRPFIFLIRDIKTSTILFVGRVMNPASE